MPAKRYRNKRGDVQTPLPRSKGGAMGERSQRSMALEWLERASAQLVQAMYEMSHVGPTCEVHWRSAKKRLVTTRERLDLAETFIDAALDPFGAELTGEREKIVSRRH